MRVKLFHLQSIFESSLLRGLTITGRLPPPIPLDFLRFCFGHVLLELRLLLTFTPLDSELLEGVDLEDVDLVLINLQH